MVRTARDAGFDGHVSTVTESTAAAASYGLTHVVVDDDDEHEHRRTLVFNMGGGTTDVTIASVRSSSTSNDDGDDDGVRFRVEAVAGDARTGGNDMDRILLEHVLSKQQQPPRRWNEHDRRSLSR